MTRREAAQRAAMTDAIAFLTLRCCRCGGADLTAVAPGSDDTPDRGWCSMCWSESLVAVRVA